MVCMTVRDPFSDDCSLRNIATGVTAIDTVNADVAKEVGNKILEMMTGKLKAEGCDVYHADADADLLIVQKRIEASVEEETAVIGEDTDLLILLIYHANKESKKIYFYSESKQNARDAAMPKKIVRNEAPDLPIIPFIKENPIHNVKWGKKTPQ
eukprot:gene10102-biopygen12747